VIFSLFEVFYTPSQKGITFFHLDNGRVATAMLGFNWVNGYGLTWDVMFVQWFMFNLNQWRK